MTERRWLKAKVSWLLWFALALMASVAAELVRLMCA